jgi:Uncharacterized conserved protein (DUF2183)
LVGDSGEQDLELYTEIALRYRDQVLGIFIRDVTTPFLASKPSSSSSSDLPLFFDGNGQPSFPGQRRPSQLNPFRDSFGNKDLSQTPNNEETVEEGDPEKFSLTEIEEFSSFFAKAEDAGEGIVQDLPDRISKTPPPLTNRPTAPRTPSSTSVTSVTFETEPEVIKPIGHMPTAGVEEQTYRVKRVENWKRRLAKARERLLIAGSGVQVWTWRVGGDVEKICEELVVKAGLEDSLGTGDREHGIKNITQKLRESRII